MNEVNFSRAVKEVKFGAWILDPKRQTITDGDVTRELEPLLFKILCYLILNNDQIITRDDLVSDVWCQNYVDNNAINRAMSELRKVLKSDKQRGLVVKTHYRKGYSFFLKTEIVYQEEVTVKATPGAIKPASKPQPAAKTKPNYLLYSVLTAACVAMSVFGITYMTKAETPLEAQIERQSVAYQESLLSWAPGRYLRTILSPSKQLLAFTFVPQGQTREMLIVKDLSTDYEKKMANQDADLYPIGWSSDSSRLFYRATKGERCEIWQVSSDFESYNKHLFDCPLQIKQGAGVGRDYFVYSKPNYRGRDELSALVSYNLSTKEEFQLTSPSLNSYGDRFLMYEPKIERIFFERHQFDARELYMTDLEGSSQIKLYESNNPIWSISYIPETHALVWFDNIENVVYEYALSEKRLVRETQLQTDNIFATSQALSPNELLLTSYPFAQDIYGLDVKSMELDELVSSKHINFSGVGGEDKTLFLRYESGVIHLAYKQGEQSVATQVPEGNYTALRHSSISGQLLLRESNTMHLYDEQFTLLKAIEVDGVVISAEYLLNGDIGYVMLGDKQSANEVYVYSQQLERSKKLPISNIVWFAQLDKHQYVMLSSNDKLLYFDIATGEVAQEVALQYTTELHLVAVGDGRVFYSNGKKVYEVVDGMSTELFDMGEKKVTAITYNASQQALVLSTVAQTNNQLIKLEAPH
ncbi:winged helix-turn-helix domain-containing protein [Pseudoalteromonas rubra]|uniref:winged helix-turn-helix domain-containing protein n=1 Tax=Pseudoalteromonas rubra TaxID=43658 RepID=UPI000696F3D9|nr:winged helix-turn-helix domain-containing protein [Pseudoalteromonas rubra]